MKTKLEMNMEKMFRNTRKKERERAQESSRSLKPIRGQAMLETYGELGLRN